MEQRPDTEQLHEALCYVVLFVMIKRRDYQSAL